MNLMQSKLLGNECIVALVVANAANLRAGACFFTCDFRGKPVVSRLASMQATIISFTFTRRLFPVLPWVTLKTHFLIISVRKSHHF